MKTLFIVPYPKDEAPSQRFRFEQYFKILSEHNIQHTITSFWSIQAWKILYKPGYVFTKAFWLLVGFTKRWIDLFRCLNYDLIFIHRESAPIGLPVMEFIIANIWRKKIIYDFDDAIWLKNTSSENKIVSWIKYHDKVKSICRWSYKVSCGNEWLADYARVFNKNVVVNPTTIDTDQLHNPTSFTKPLQKEIIIGWTGTHSTLFYLNALAPVLSRLEEKYPIKIQIISNKKPDIKLNSIEFIPWNKQAEIKQLMQFDIGIMPLLNDDWAKGKCGFKALQYMALGIPPVASPVGINNSIIENGVNGFLCNSGDEWFSILEMLIGDKSLRDKIGAEGRKKVIQNYSVASNSTNFLSLTRL